MGASKANHRPPATPLRAPGARCPAALALALALALAQDSGFAPGRPREIHAAGFAESRPPDTVPTSLGSILSVSQEGLRGTKRLRPAKSCLPEITGGSPSVGNPGRFGVTAVPVSHTGPGPVLTGPGEGPGPGLQAGPGRELTSQDRGPSG